MGRIFVKSLSVAMSSLVASFLFAYAVVPTLGGVVDGNAWLILTICPLLIAWPASALVFCRTIVSRMRTEILPRPIRNSPPLTDVSKKGQVATI